MIPAKRSQPFFSHACPTSHQSWGLSNKISHWHQTTHNIRKMLVLPQSEVQSNEMRVSGYQLLSRWHRASLNIQRSLIPRFINIDIP